jgi:hypothetical protein
VTAKLLLASQDGLGSSEMGIVFIVLSYSCVLLRSFL